jgi:peptidyl-prolyl cis-trans isomerase C
MEWKASHILIKNRGQAQELLRKVKQGAAFEAIARDYSTCPSKSKGGDLGWFGEGKMVPQFESAVKRMGIGSVSNLIQTQFGFHIIKLTGRR